MTDTPLPPVEIPMGTVTTFDSVALYNGKSRNPKYVRVRMIAGDDPVTLYLREGTPITLPASQKIRVASRPGSR